VDPSFFYFEIQCSWYKIKKRRKENKVIMRTAAEAGAVRRSFSNEAVFWLRLQGETKPASQGFRGRAHTGRVIYPAVQAPEAHVG